MFKIELKDCGKSFNRQWLFRNLSLNLETGESWAVTGKNGAGKSTFMLMLASQLLPTEGSIERKNNNGNIPLEQAFSTCSLASPAMELPDEFSATDLFRLQEKVKPFRMVNAAVEFAEMAGFNQSTMNKALGFYSSGMKQRLKLALAVFSDTPLLLLDEPLTNLDKTGEYFFQSLIEKHTSNRLVVVAGNREEEFSFCQKKIQIASALI